MASSSSARPSERPFVTVGIPCLNEERFIETCIRCVLEQDYPLDRLEIIVADGGSTDRTREILDELSQKYLQVSWIDNPDKIQAPAMNAIIRRARGEVLVRLDAHCEYAGNYISKCIETLEKTGADNVGGSQRAKPTSFFQRALCAAMESPMGVGGARYKSATYSGFVDTVFCGAFRRRVFETVGMFDPGAITNEDAELNQRIIEAGGKVYLSSEIVAHYHPRDSFQKLAKQYYKYGRGRARTFLKLGQFMNVRPLVPFFAVLGGTGLLATSALQPFTLPAFGTYGALTAVEAIRVGRKEGLAAIPVVWAIFPVLHASHGIGFAAGLLRYLREPDWSEPERVAQRRAEPAFAT